MIRTILSLSLLLFLPVSLTAGEIELTLEKSGEGPSFYFGLNPQNASQPSWEKGSESFTQNASTYDFYFPWGIKEGSRPGTRLLTLDRRAEGDGNPDTLIIDLNRNREIDEGERFDLEAPSTESPFGPGYTVLSVAALPFVMGSATRKPLLTLYLLIPDATPEGSINLIFGLSAWGCRRGEATIDGVTYTVTLHDRLINGAYDDFQEGNSRQNDTISFVPKEGGSVKEAPNFGTPLRRKMILAGKTYDVRVMEGGARLQIDPITVDYGHVAAAAGDVGLTLVHPDWGNQRIEPDEKKRLPTGTWTVQDFSCTKGEGQPICFYAGPPEMQVEIISGNTVTMKMETRLIPEVTQKAYGDSLNLSLALATTQGAKFRSYFGGNDTKNPFKGIPFVIQNGSGETVQEGLFTFG